MITIYRILSLAIVLGIIVLVHEFGHYVAARLMGVRVEVFSFGFGKRLFGKKVGDTDFRVSLIPLGGFVKMAGEEDFEGDVITGKKGAERDSLPAEKKEYKPYEFQSKNRAQKIFILTMGPFMNLFLAFFILTMINVTGVEVQKYKTEVPVIGFVKPDSPAAQAGLQVGDTIQSLNNRSLRNWKELEMFIAANPNETLIIGYKRDSKEASTKLKVGATKKNNLGFAGISYLLEPEIYSVGKDSPAEKAGLLGGDMILAINDRNIKSYFTVSEMISQSLGQVLKFKIDRKGEVLEMSVTPQQVDEGYAIGIRTLIPMKEEKYTLLPAMQKSLRDISQLMSLILDAVRKMIVGKLSLKSMSGPIDIAKFSHSALQSGLSNFFMLIAFISLNLGIINLFPIPVLDGGHLMIYSIEAVIRREFSPRVKTMLMNIGFVILIALMVFIILNDVAKILPNGWKSLLPF